MSFNNGQKVKSYITTWTGKKFDFMNVSSKNVDVKDIVHALPKLTRYVGHTDRFYSVGEHSLLCKHIAEQLGLPYLMQFYMLIHDATEVYCQDMPKPLKQHLHNYIEKEDEVMSAIFEYFGVRPPTEQEEEIMKLIDNTLLYIEMKYLKKNVDVEEDLDGVDYIDVDIDITEEVYPNIKEKLTEEINTLLNLIRLGDLK